MQERIKWIDIAKGIAMMFVVIAHTYDISLPLRSLIFSFHMPMFFLLSGYTFRKSSNFEIFRANLKKNSKRLMLPAIFLFLVFAGFSYYNKISDIGLPAFFIEILKSMFFASGVNIYSFSDVVWSFGMMWFLVALFLIKTLYDYFSLKFSLRKLVILISFLTLLGLFFAIKEVYLFLSFDIVLMALPFFFIGDCLKTVKINIPLYLKLVIFCLIWLLSFRIISLSISPCLEFATRSYPLFPLCYICAFAGTMFFCYVSELLTSCGILSKLLLGIGKNSFYLFCVHSLDFVWKPLWTYQFGQIFNSIIRLIVDVIITFVILILLNKIKKLKKE